MKPFLLLFLSFTLAPAKVKDNAITYISQAIAKGGVGGAGVVTPEI